MTIFLELCFQKLAFSEMQQITPRTSQKHKLRLRSSSSVKFAQFAVVFIISAFQLQFFKSNMVNTEVIQVQKCCEYQQLVWIDGHNCAYCQKLPSETTETAININGGIKRITPVLDKLLPDLHLKHPSIFYDRFSFSKKPLLPLSSSIPSTAAGCQFQMSRFILSKDQIQQNLTRNGYLLLESTFYPAASYCMDSMDLEFNQVEILVKSANNKKFQINKCCQLNEVFDIQKNSCVPWIRDKSRRSNKNTNNNGNGRFGQNLGQRGRRRGKISQIQNQNNLQNLNVNSWVKYFNKNYTIQVADNWLAGEVTSNKGINGSDGGYLRRVLNFTTGRCWNQYSTRFNFEAIESEINWNLNFESNDGVFIRGAWKTVQNKDFCVETIQNYNGFCHNNHRLNSLGTPNEFNIDKMHQQQQQQQMTDGNEDIIIIFYYGETADPFSASYGTLMGLFWILTSVFLFTAAIINVAIIQRNIHGWVLFSYLMSSALLNVVAGIFIILVDNDKEKIGCNFLDFFQKFLYLSTLCWMTSINFDLWYAFRKLEPTVQNSSRRFPLYILFSWSVPIIIITLGWYIGTQKQRSIIDGSPILLPHCIIYDYSIIVYMSGPVIALVGINLLLFTRTVMILHGLRNTSKKILQRSYKERESFKLFTKLFLMTGPIWVLRIVLLALQIQGTYLTWYGFLIEVIFIVPDITFFLLVIFHRKVIERVKLLTFLKGIPCCYSFVNVVQSPKTTTQTQQQHENNNTTCGSLSRSVLNYSSSDKRKSSNVCMVTLDAGGRPAAGTTQTATTAATAAVTVTSLVPSRTRWNNCWARSEAAEAETNFV